MVRAKVTWPYKFHSTSESSRRSADSRPLHRSWAVEAVAQACAAFGPIELREFVGRPGYPLAEQSGAR